MARPGQRLRPFRARHCQGKENENEGIIQVLINKSGGGSSIEIVLGPALVKLENDMETPRSQTAPAAQKKRKFSERQDDPGPAKMRNSVYPPSETIHFSDMSMLETETPPWTSSTNTFSLHSSGEDSLQSSDPRSATQVASLPDSPMLLSPPHCDIQFGAVTQEGEASYRSLNAVTNGLETCNSEIRRATRNQPQDAVSTAIQVVDLTSGLAARWLRYRSRGGYRFQSLRPVLSEPA